MATAFSFSGAISINFRVFIFSVILAAASANFYNEAEITWGDGRAKILDSGNLLTLSLDRNSGSGFQSRNQFLFGRFDMQIKLVQGNSAGTVTTFFLSSQGANHDEIDFEFLGNSSGDPYTLHTNIFAKGKGDREQQFRLWFDPTAAFHTYSVVWNPQRIILLVDQTPIRVFSNHEANGIPFPNSQPMTIYASLWDAEDWATQGGRVKTDWNLAPFTASYMNMNINGCLPGQCSSQSLKTGAWQTEGLNAEGLNQLKSVQQRFMIYNYCTDFNRFPQGIPTECKLNSF